MYAIYDQPLQSTLPGKYHEFRLIDQGNGEYTAIFADGTVLSVQPDGSWEHRDPGTNSAYERFVKEGNIGTFYPLSGSYFPYPIYKLRS